MLRVIIIPSQFFFSFSFFFNMPSKVVCHCVKLSMQFSSIYSDLGSFMLLNNRCGILSN